MISNEDTKNKGQVQNERKAKKRKQNKDFLLDPMKIVETVMAGASCKNLDLSRQVALRLQQNDAIEQLKSVEFGSQRISMMPAESSTVLPHGFQDMKVNLSPFAITHIACINELPQKRFRNRRKRGKKSDKGGVDREGAATGSRQQSPRKGDNSHTTQKDGVSHSPKKNDASLMSANKKLRKHQPLTSVDSTQLTQDHSQEQTLHIPKQAQLQDPYVLRWLT